MVKGNRRRILLIVAVSAAVISAAVVVGIAVHRDAGKSLLKVMSDRIDLQVRNVHYTEVGDSGMKWEIKADAARYQKKENLALFDNLKVKLILKDGQTFVMTGDRGRLNTESRDMQIEGNVGIVSDNGDRFTTDRLRYRNADRIVETERPVAMENGSVRISGVGMVVSLDARTVAILSQVRARVAAGAGETK